MMDEVVDGYEQFEANDIQASDDDAIKRILGMFTERLLTRRIAILSRLVGDFTPDKSLISLVRDTEGEESSEDESGDDCSQD